MTDSASVRDLSYLYSTILKLVLNTFKTDQKKIYLKLNNKVQYNVHNGIDKLNNAWSDGYSTSSKR